MINWLTDPQSPHGKRPVCTGADIDAMMEEHYLKSFDKGCDLKQPAFDVERFVGESLRKEGIDYDPDATDLPSGVLGLTQFNPDGTRLIRIGSELSRAKELQAVRGRFRFTCAHEAFHALYHGPLFKQGRSHSACAAHNIREDMVEPSQGGCVEWQANRGAAALLMPKLVFTEEVRRMRVKVRNPSIRLLARSLAEAFGVSVQSAQIRLGTLGLMASPSDDLALQYDGVDSYRDQRERQWR